MSSPCNNVCTLRGNLCVGCFRTIDEIFNWGGMDLETHHKILKDIDSRAKCPQCGKWNKCAVEEGKSVSTCWCVEIAVPSDMSENVAFGSSCYCRSCVREAQ